MPSSENGGADPRPAPGPREGTDATTAFAELGRIELADNDLNGVLGKVASLANDTIPNSTGVAVTLMVAGVATSAADTGELARAMDERQYDVGFGPCLDAARDQQVYLVRDTTAEARWPAFMSGAVARGVRSTLSVGIPVRDTVTGALNIYALVPDAFDDDTVAVARTFAGYAAVALANAHLYETTSALAAQMSDAMASRAVIEQAKGVLMAQQHVSPQQAFDVLSAASQRGNRKLRDIAQAIVDAEQNRG